MTHANRICLLLLLAARVALAAAPEPELLRLASVAGRFGKLSDAEHKMFWAAASGGKASCTDVVTDQIDPGEADKWDDDRYIRPDCIAWLCRDPAARLVSRRGIRVVGACINGNLDLDHATIAFPLSFKKCCFRGAIVLRNTVLPCLSLEGTHTGRIEADQLKVAGHVFLSDGFQAKGEVRLFGATIGRCLNCNGGQFSNNNGDALNADGLNADGVFLGKGFRADGEVCLRRAVIGRDLNCNGGQFYNRERNALSADGLKVDGVVFLRDGFRVEGTVSLMSAEIRRNLISVDWQSPETATLDLRSARVGTLWDQEASWPVEGRLFLHGLVYGELADKALLGVEARKRWLRLQPDDPFHPQPYEQLAKVLRQQGREEDAKQILIAKNDERVRLAKMSWCSRLWHRFLGWSLGYGYRPWRPVWAALFFAILGVVLFGRGHQNDLMQMKDGSLDRNFNLVVYTIDLFVPVVNFHQAEAWWPDARKGRWGWWLRFYAWTHMAAGWVITTLLIVGLTGLVRG
jgi:hypothetical protein